MEEQNTEQNMRGNYYIGAQKSIAHISKRMLYGESLSKLHRIRDQIPDSCKHAANLWKLHKMMAPIKSRDL